MRTSKRNSSLAVCIEERKGEKSKKTKYFSVNLWPDHQHLCVRQDAKGEGQEGRPEEGHVDAETEEADGAAVQGTFCVIC